MRYDPKRTEKGINVKQPPDEWLHRAKEPCLLPLGGAGEIGANFYLYTYQGSWIAVDCGQGFLNDTPGGTGTTVPSIEALIDYGIQLDAIVITHAHEDHIGAIPYLWSRLNCPLYATPFAQHLIRDRLDRHQSWPTMHQVKAGQPYSIGAFEVEWIPVTHSIPEAFGLAIQAGERMIYHTGDWKIDPSPGVGHRLASSRLQALGRAGVDVLIGDSTNAPVAGHSVSEHQVAQGLVKTIEPLEQRVVVSCFASNIARLAALGQAAKQTRRFVTLLGRSMWRLYHAGKACGYLDDFPHPISPRDAGFLPRHEQLWICTGSQGEPEAALSRLAAGQHPSLELEAGDHVLLSAKTIPGNELAVERLINALLRLKVNLITPRHALIHASGHPCQEELALLYEWLKPKRLVPVHGEFRHQQAHAQLAMQKGIQCQIVSDGELMQLAPSLQRLGEVAHGRWLVDGHRLLAPDSALLDQRRQLAEQGLLHVRIGPGETLNIHAPGLSLDLATLHQWLQSQLQSGIPASAGRLKLQLERWCWQQWGKRPLILVDLIPSE